MAGIKFYDYQIDAIKKMSNGCILCGGVGSGKSFTALGYYYLINGGDIYANKYTVMRDNPPLDLYIITTARKRDTREWDKELIPFLLSTNPEDSPYKNKVVIDSWNNITKYVDVKNAFFIFDEQRVVGKGTWVKSFLKITKSNLWILLSATPGDTWMDYLPVFLANGFFKNRTEFYENHCVFNRFVKYPKIDRYVGIKRLERMRNRILVDMDFNRKTKAKHYYISCSYDEKMYNEAVKKRWDPFKEEPMQNAGSLCYVLRRIVNDTRSRTNRISSIIREHGKLIVFYNFDYERDRLIAYCTDNAIRFSEWSGHAHQELPEGKQWIYLVQYTAGCEGWNCIKTDTIVFYSQNYSYKVMQQAIGRIDRLNTPFEYLYYYHLVSDADIDKSIAKAIKTKKIFNEGKFAQRKGFENAGSRDSEGHPGDSDSEDRPCKLYVSNL